MIGKGKKNPSPIRILILNTPSQARGYKSYAPSLSRIYQILGPLRDLVNMIVSWLFELLKVVFTYPDESSL